MTEFIRNHDRYLDPPDPPTHGDCTNCGERHDYDDMWHIGKYSDTWLCDECYEEYCQQLMDEAENE